MASQDLAPPSASCAGVTEIPLTECQALELLYNTTRGPEWSYNQGWLEDQNPCNWIGVQCADGHVSGLSLSFNLLSGMIPSEIGNLSELQTLNLIRNKITSIPEEIRQLSKLQELYLTGNRLRSIPSGIGDLENLKVLHLSENGITSLPKEMGKLHTLEILHLHNASLFDIPAEIANLTNLRELQFTTGSVSTISNALSQMSQLEVLSLPHNHLTLVPPGISTLHHLRELDLSHNNLVELPAEIGNLTKLEKLNLSTNQIAHIPTELAGLKRLRILDLAYNQLSKLPSEIGQLSALERLDVAANQLANVPAEIEYLTNLYQGLHLAYNRLTEVPTTVESSGLLRRDWQSTQTVAPHNVTTTIVDQQTVLLSWTAIPFTDSLGYYEIGIGSASGGPYKVLGRTDSKADTSYSVEPEDAGPYYFVIRTYTSAHSDHNSYLWSQYSGEAAAYLPKLNVAHADALVGKMLDAVALGFPPLQSIQFTVNGMHVKSLTSNSLGALAFTLNTANADPGRYELRLTTNADDQSLEAQAILILNEADNEHIITDEERSATAPDKSVVRIPEGLALSLVAPSGSDQVFLPITTQ